MPSHKIDVVISTLNNLSKKSFSIYYTIRSLLSQSHARLNIIIADNGSDDFTGEKLKNEFGQKINILDTSECRGNISASRNRAAECGNCNTILFLDDDMVLSSPNVLEKTLKVIKNVDFACGAVRLWSPILWPDMIRKDDPIIKILSTLENTSYEPYSINRISGKNIIDNRSYLANFGMIKRSAYENIGGYDEDYVGWGYQDTDLMWRLCVSGFEYDLFSRYNIIVYHLAHTVNKSEYYEENRKRFLEKQMIDGRFFHTNHFFEIYENDGYSLFSDIFEESK